MNLKAVQDDGQSDAEKWLQSDPDAEEVPARKVYRALLLNPQSDCSRQFSRRFLMSRITLAGASVCDLPDELEQWQDWVAASARSVADDYRKYLQGRKGGAPRQYFSRRSQALSFITKVAPTKLVDGAWLYGVMEYWNDLRFQPLVATFLEELGNGDPDRNHVLLYKKLLAEEGCDQLEELDDSYYHQGAVQLALGYHASEFLPELIGYNLGYEQLPLHLLITAHELDELDIDPYYFTLHITIDNASTGHAQRAVQAVLDNLPADEGARERFLQRVRQGYTLNNLGAGSVDMIGAFDIEQEVIDILKRKSRFGLVHSDYCKIKGLTVNQWLVDSEQIPCFLAALIEEGWIKRDQDPRHSRFWQLLEGPKAKMFGVFSRREKDLIHEWIAGEWREKDQAAYRPGSVGGEAGRDENELHDTKWKWLTQRGACVPIRGNAIPTCPPESGDRETDAGRATTEKASSPEMMRRLIALMAPGRHHTPAGLRATRVFCSLCGHRD